MVDGLCCFRIPVMSAIPPRLDLNIKGGLKSGIHYSVRLGGDTEVRAGYSFLSSISIQE
jgi:hypothetical protein